jgi:hypothetical protein
VAPVPSPAPDPAPAPALTLAQEKEKALKQMLFGGGAGGLGLGMGMMGLGASQQQQQQQQQQKKEKEGEEEKEVARVLEGMAAEEAALAARRRTWKAPLLFERLRGSYEAEAGAGGSSVRPGAVALTRQLRALLYGLVGVQGAVREEVLLADDTCVCICAFVGGRDG